MLTEPHQSRIGAIKELSVRKTRRKKRTDSRVGEIYHCTPFTWESWKYPFRGMVEKILSNSAVVMIVSTHESNDPLMMALYQRTVGPLRNLEENL